MKRAVRSLILLIAAGMMVFGLMEIMLEYSRHRVRHEDIRLWYCVLGTILIVLGGGLAVVSRPLADRLTDDFDE